MDPRGITVPTDNRAIVVGTGNGTTAGNEQYQVIDTTLPSSMQYCGGYVVSSGIYGVSSILDQYSTAYSYIITGESGNQFKIIRGGVGGGGYAASGTFTSAVFCPGYQTAFNQFTSTISQPSNTTIKMQVAVAPQASGICTNAAYTYVGPLADTSSYFTPDGNNIIAAIPFGTASPSYQNPNYCYCYKVFFTSNDTSKTPTFYDTTVNYSP
jgi:hypothetical protein